MPSWLKHQKQTTTDSSVNNFYYDKNNFEPCYQEDTKELVSEAGTTVRKHFGLYNVLIKYDDTLAEIKKGVAKKLRITFLNNLFTPQYLTVRLLGVPEGWTFKDGTEFCVGLEHWHGSHNDNSFDLEFVPEEISHGQNTFVMEISTNGRMTKNYISLAFINGASR